MGVSEAGLEHQQTENTCGSALENAQYGSPKRSLTISRRNVRTPPTWNLRAAETNLGLCVFSHRSDHGCFSSSPLPRAKSPPHQKHYGKTNWQAGVWTTWKGPKQSSPPPWGQMWIVAASDTRFLTLWGAVVGVVLCFWAQVCDFGARRAVLIRRKVCAGFTIPFFHPKYETKQAVSGLCAHEDNGREAAPAR